MRIGGSIILVHCELEVYSGSEGACLGVMFIRKLCVCMLVCIYVSVESGRGRQCPLYLLTFKIASHFQKVPRPNMENLALKRECPGKV